MVNSFEKRTKKKRIWHSILLTLAAVTVFVTTYALIIPAITWERSLICELEEHRHTDFCYNSNGELKCNKEEHVHTDSCFDAPKEALPAYICGKTEHKHTADCYFANGTLKCTVSEHTHTDACLNNKLFSAPNFLLSAGPNSLIYVSDPDTSDIKSWFKENDEYLASNDGRIAADKTVKTFNPRNDQFEVTLSALGQTYKSEIPENKRIHPDVVFILDISNSMFTNSVSDGNGGQITRAEAVVNAVNKSIEQLLEADPDTRIGIVSYGNECTDDRLYLELGNYKLNSGSGWLTYDDNYTKASNGTRLLHIPLSDVSNGGSYPLDLYGEFEGYTLTITPNNGKTQYTVRATKGSTTVTWTVGIGTQDSPQKSGLVNFNNNNNNRSAEVVCDGTYLDFYYHYDRTDGPAHTIAVNSNLRNADGTTDGIVYAPFIGIDGTYTQAGIMTAADMLINGAKEKRVPSIILVSDGEPTYAYAYDTAHPETLLDAFHSHRLEEGGNTGGYGLLGDGKFGNGKSGNATQAGSAYDRNGNLRGTNTNNSRGALMGYYTVRTAMYVKDAVYDAYYDKFLDYYKGLTDEGGQKLLSDAEAEEQTKKSLDAMFFSVGPGVTSLYGKTVLGPGNPNSDDDTKTNLEVSQNDNTASFGDVTPARFYEILTTELQKEGKSGLDFVDYADYSIAGNMTAPELDEGMQGIVNRISGVPRPVTTTKDTIKYDVIKQDAFVTFTDTLGKDMILTDGGFTLTYDDQEYKANLVETDGVLEDDSLYNGCHYQRYEFTGIVKEQSTGNTMNLKDIRVYVITREDGTQVVLWQFPSEFLPVIYHQYKFNGAGLVGDEYHAVEPIRLKYNVGVDGTPVPGRTYYSNSTEDVASVVVQLTDDNPYYDSDYQPEEKAKTQNSTDTKSYSFETNAPDNTHLTVRLGNNGKLRTPFSLAVHKNWDDTATTHDPITVHLYANGEDTGLTVVLNDSNGWAANFPGNLNAEDQNGDLIKYTVREEVPEGYTVTGENDEPKMFTYEIKTGNEASWGDANSFEVGEIYRLRIENKNANGLVVKDDGSGNLTSGVVSNSTTDTAEQWLYTSEHYLMNVASEKYLKRSNSRNSPALYYTNNNWYMTTVEFDSSNRYIILTDSYSSRLNHNNGSFNLRTTSQSATRYYLERLVPETINTTETTEFGFDLTNKPLEISISAEKVWGIGTDGMEKPVDLTVYEKKVDGTVSVIGTMTLTAEGSWKASFNKSPAVPTSTYYVSETNADEFTAGYTGGDVVNLTYGGEIFQAVKIDPQHAAEITVTNTMIRAELPATGGPGTALIYVIGALLMFGALIIGYVIWRRHEGRREL